MKTIPELLHLFNIMKLIKIFGASSAALAACLALNTANLLAQDGISVKLGQPVARSFDDVKAAGYAYGPKQDIDASSGETHIYLPYGNNPKLYAEGTRGATEDATGHVAVFHSSDGNSRAQLTYKLNFDKPISALKFWAGNAEVNLAGSSVAGVEYSVDGKEWKTLKEWPKATNNVVEPFADKVGATGLNTSTLYIRIYTRDSANPTSDGGPQMWIKMRTSGDPTWGDASSTFFTNQNQVWVTSAK